MERGVEIRLHGVLVGKATPLRVPELLRLSHRGYLGSCLMYDV